MFYLTYGTSLPAFYRKSTTFQSFTGFSGSLMSVTQPMLQIPKTSSTSDKTDPWVTKADPNSRIGEVKALTSAATTNNQYLILFIPTILPQPNQMSSPPHFLSLFPCGPGQRWYSVSRSADQARVGDQGLPRLRYNVIVRISVIGHLDFQGGVHTVPRPSNVNLDRSQEVVEGFK